ncbi:MAG: HEAT repeat domain-containing protein [Planctomycetes bacterium]|nr:HEAT repeat domain-containing protein [Planctomycetota bacterium]
MKRHAILALAVAMGSAAVLWLCGCNDPTKDLESDDPAKLIPAVRASANRASDDTADKVAKVIRNRDTMVSAEAVRSLGAMRRPRAVKILTEVASGVEEKRGAVRQEAVIQLGTQRSPEALNTLRQVLKADPDPRVRAAAATSISRQRSLPDVALLVEVAENETDPVVQARAVGSVERLIGLKFGYDPRASPAERQKALLRMRGMALTAASSLEQRARRGKNP